ncbi:MAG: hypothetical protein V3R96_02640 [Dehalococcoidales bacterium]
MAEAKSQQRATVASATADEIRVLNPACKNTLVERVPLAPRTFASLAGKTIYLVDIGWGGPDAAYDVFQLMQEWFAGNIPSVKTVLVRKKGAYGVDDPDLWSEIKAKGDACIIGISC